MSAASRNERDAGSGPADHPVLPERPLVRADLIIVRTFEEDSSKYTIKVPDTGSFFQIGIDEYDILRLMDGQSTYDELSGRAEDELDLAVDPSVIRSFARLLHEADCLESESGGAERSAERKKEDKKSTFRNPLFISIDLINPDRFITKIEPHLGFFYTKTFVYFVPVFFAVNLLIVISDFDRFVRDLQTLSSIAGVFVLYFSATAVVALHEMAHGVTCKHYGGRVPSMGVLLILLTIPCLFTDVSDAWLFSKKRHRLWVTAAGVFFESVLWGIAVLLWQVTAADSLISQIALGVLVSSSIGMILTINPLLKFDGYYFLSDVLEIPNLRDKSLQYFSLWLGGVLDGNTSRLPRVTRRERRIFLIYGVLAVCFTFLILGSVLFGVAEFVVREYGIIAILPVLYFGWKILGPIILGVWHGMTAEPNRKTGESAAAANDRERSEAALPATVSTPAVPVRPERRELASLDEPEKARKRFRPRIPRKAFLVVVLVAVIASNFGYGDLEISGYFKIKPEAAYVVNPEISGLVQEVYVRQGDQVERGDPLFQLDTRLTRTNLALAEADLRTAENSLTLVESGPKSEAIAMKRASLDVAKTRVAYTRDVYQRLSKLSDSAVSAARLNEARHAWDVAKKRAVVEAEEFALMMSDPRAEQLEMHRANISKIKLELAKLKYELYRSRVVANVSGVVVSEDLQFLAGRYVDRGDALIKIESVDNYKAVVAVRERDIAAIALGQKVRLKVYGYPSKELFGVVLRISPSVGASAIDGLPASTIEVEVEVEDPEDLLKTGMTGEARILTEQRSYFDLLFRQFIHWFKIQFWW